MNDEIKEILSLLNSSSWSNEAIQIENYITNLQQKAKYYEETQTFGDYVKEVNLLIDYKSRIEKAIEYMQDFIFEPLLVQEDRKLIMYNRNLRKFENILNGRSDE